MSGATSSRPSGVGIINVIQVLDTIDELLDVWSEQMDNISPKLARDDLHPSAPIIVHGLTAHVADLARGAALLYRAEVTVAAIPLIRAMLEDVATIEHVLDKPDGWKDVQNASLKQRRLILKDFEATGEALPWFEEARSHLEWMRENGAVEQGAIKDRFPAPKPGQVSSYTQYRNLSDEIHAGMGVVVKYTESDPGVPGSYGLSAVARNGSAPVKLLEVTDSLTRALMAWNTLWGSSSIRARLLEIDDRQLVRFVDEALVEEET